MDKIKDIFKKYWLYIVAFFALVALAFSFRPRSKSETDAIIRRVADSLKKSSDASLKASDAARQANRKRIEAQTPEETDKEANEWLK